MIYLLTLVITIIYIFFIFLLRSKWLKIPYSEKTLAADDFLATVVVPVRNEAANIKTLVDSILASNQTGGRYELLIIDDHSDDNTAAFVIGIAKTHQHIHLLKLPGDLEGKKAAITYGVSQANSQLIICTDGDGLVGPHWLAHHKAAFSRGAKLSFGPVLLFGKEKSSVIDGLNLELSALVTTGAATLQLGKPTMINGCNYSFSKDAFEFVNGFLGNESVPTGDDEFLLRKIFASYPKEITFIKHEEALVKSKAPASLSTFYNQRKRWASKWRLHEDNNSKLLSVFIFSCYALWILALIYSFIENNFYGVTIIGLKGVVDYVYVSMGSKLQERRVSLVIFFGLQIIYPIYVVFFGLASNFGKYRWRKRTYSTQT